MKYFVCRLRVLQTWCIKWIPNADVITVGLQDSSQNLFSTALRECIKLYDVGRISCWRDTVSSLSNAKEEFSLISQVWFKVWKSATARNINLWICNLLGFDRASNGSSARTFPDNLSLPYYDATDTTFRNVDPELPFNSAQNHKRAHISFTSWRRLKITQHRSCYDYADLCNGVPLAKYGTKKNSMSRILSLHAVS